VEAAQKAAAAGNRMFVRTNESVAGRELAALLYSTCGS